MTITILGKLPDTAAYLDRPGYNVWPATHKWTPEKGRAWIVKAVARGDKFLLVSTDFSGAYFQEIRILQAEAQMMRTQAGVLNAQALELNEAIRDMSKRAIAHLGPVLPIGTGGEKCAACNHARANHNQDIGNGEMTECSECGCHRFATMT